jgi:hypothetical protein
MKLIKITALVLSATLFGATQLSAADFNKAYQEADDMRKKAASMSYEWRDTGKLLKSAKKANDAGKADKAMTLVAKALEQSNDAIAQANREADAWKSRVPK